MMNSPAFIDRIRHRRYTDYLASLCMQEDASHAYITLLCIADELARIKEVTSDASTDLIRLVWWKEALEDLFDNHTIRGHELLEPLAKIVEKYSLSKEPFMTLIEAHEQDLQPFPPANLGALKAYASNRTLPLWDMAATIQGTPLTDELKALATPTGMIQLLARWPEQLKHGQVIFPEDMLRQYQSHAQAVLDGTIAKPTLLHMAKELAKTQPISITKADIKTHPQLISAWIASRQQHRLRRRGYLSTPLSLTDYAALWFTCAV